MTYRYPRREIPDDNGICMNQAFINLLLAPPGACSNCIQAAKQRISGTCLVCGAQHDYKESEADDDE